ncbi:MAG: hypothetical protein ABIQ31_27110 [Ferruginibacter sp.]
MNPIEDLIDKLHLFDFDRDLNVITITTYRGVQIDKEWFLENPEMEIIYTNREKNATDFYDFLKARTTPGKKSLLLITEFDVFHKLDAI